MKKIKIILIVLFILNLNPAKAQFLSRFSLGIQVASGFDMQQIKKKYLPTRLVIPSRLGSSFVVIHNPSRKNITLSYSVNDNIDFFASYGNTIRDLYYWREDSIVTQDINCAYCKFNLQIKQNDLYIGIKFKTNFKSKLNFYTSFSVGSIWVKSSNRYATGKAFNNSPQVEIFSLHDGQNWYALQVLQNGNFFDAGTLSLQYTTGITYKIWKSLFFDLSFSYDNEINTDLELIIWKYDNELKNKVGPYNPLHLIFKSLYTNTGLIFHF